MNGVTSNLFISACYPLFNKDPFIVEKSPHILFSGNHDQLDYKILEGKVKEYFHQYIIQGNIVENNSKVLLLTLPRFSLTKSFALVNLKNYEVRPVTIDTCFE